MRIFRGALAALLLLQVASANPGGGEHAGGFEGVVLPPDGTAVLPVEVSMGCDTIVRSGGGSADVQATSSAAWLGATSTTVTFDPSECLAGPTGTIVKQAELTLTPAADAPGLVVATLEASIVYVGEAPAPMGGTTQTPVFLPDVQVAYRPGHALSPGGDQAFTVLGGSHSFNLTIEVTSNAQTMVLFEDQKAIGGGLVSGLQPLAFDVAAGNGRLVQPVTFTAPAEAWESVLFTFRNSSRCADAAQCAPQLQQNVTWTFTNGDAATAQAGKDAKGAPGPLLPSILAALGLTLIAVRRRK